MASVAVATPSPKKTPVVRHKSASPWRIARFGPYPPTNPPTNPLIPVLPSLALAPSIPNPIYQASSSAEQNNPQRLPEKVVQHSLSFSLLENGIPRDPREEELPELQRLFPTLRNVSFQHPFLVLLVEKLPEHPWPTILAGLPLWLATTAEGRPPVNIGSVARSNQRFNVNGKIEYYKTPNEATILEIFELVNEKGAGVNRITWDGCGFHAFGNQAPGQGWQNRLPSRINNFFISYTWTKSTMEEHALRMKVPTMDATDDTRYPRDQLRPGIMIAGFQNNMKDGLGTTAGVCVESPTSSKKFITVAAHGFTASVGDAVFHPRVALLNGKPDPRYQIATIERKFGDTDIALAELEPDIRYSAETFTDPQPDQPQAQPFRSLKNPADLKVFDMVYMNTPVNGLCQGQHIATDWALGFEATDEAPQERKTYCDISQFSYWGNGSDIFFEGCCGGVIWNDDFDVLGQFRFQEKDGARFAFSPSFKILIDLGYKLSSI
ncbi:Uncharacterized protein BP5553_07830 [Venustampulla echinocandica]|uniref:Uncharacterized protein n=1 Tax=Venustampulla echinocandica TaxID=2656787 RepID=A0A370THM7_9HELO|nr:Uncharacterized protein BP5553_07830 [Venustampulla echinocandica]RDL34702.1 Uncharacterized protein BP5553_07830 [Venustampulla echinocandica]